MLLIQWDGNAQDDVKLFIDNEVIPVENKVRIIDLSTGKEVPAQVLNKRREGAYWVLEVSDIPAMGYKALKIEVTGQTALQLKPDQIQKSLRTSFTKL